MYTAKETKHKICGLDLIRNSVNQCKLAVEIAAKRRGNASKTYVVSEHNKASRLKYIFACKEAKNH